MKVKKLQQGGGAPAPQEGGNPEEQIMAMAQQIVEQIGPEAAAMLAQAIMQMAQGAAQGGGASQGQPTYARKGGKLVKIK